MKFKKILPQFLTLLFIVLIFGFFTMNAQVNMDNRGIEFGFGFLSQAASFDIQFSLIDYDGSRSYARAYLGWIIKHFTCVFHRYYFVYDFRSDNWCSKIITKLS
jgi:general L-amino acid transport system permease protein